MLGYRRSRPNRNSVKRRSSINSMNQYSRIRVLGEGSFGVALLVSMKANPKQLLVIKQIKLKTNNADYNSSMLNEVQVLKKLHHKNIVQFYKAFIENNKLMILLEYVENKDMRQHLNHYKNQKRSIKQVKLVNWFEQLCCGIEYIHSLNVIHRDIKPSNIFISKDNVIKIGDFGISKTLQDTLDVASTLVGTPLYMSPELCSENNYDQSADIFSMGVILYELITLIHPFSYAKNLASLVSSIVKCQYNKKLLHESAYSRELCYLVEITMQVNPLDRPSISALSELVQQLRQSLVHQSNQQLMHSKQSEENRKDVSNLSDSDYSIALHIINRVKNNNQQQQQSRAKPSEPSPHSRPEPQQQRLSAREIERRRRMRKPSTCRQPVQQQLEQPLSPVQLHVDHLKQQQRQQQLKQHRAASLDASTTLVIDSDSQLLTEAAAVDEFHDTILLNQQKHAEKLRNMQPRAELKKMKQQRRRSIKSESDCLEVQIFTPDQQFQEKHSLAPPKQPSAVAMDTVRHTQVQDHGDFTVEIYTRRPSVQAGDGGYDSDRQIPVRCSRKSGCKCTVCQAAEKEYAAYFPPPPES